MSDFSINQYSEKPDKDNKNAEDPFSGFLTKAQHRNPEIHVLGDNLPQEILAYQAGSATLQPDVGGNTPVLLRNVQEAFGPGVVQSATLALVQLAGISVVATCPLQASGSPYVLVSFRTLIGVQIGPGATVTDFNSSLFVNGVAYANGRGYMGITPYIRNSWYPMAIPNIKVPITPGQTLTLDWRISATSVAPTAQTLYVVNDVGLDTALLAELYY
jgi:hypothetical protein